MSESEFKKIDTLAQILNEIGSRVNREHSEREVELMFLNQGFFRSLGFENVGKNLRSEYSLPSQKQVDLYSAIQFICRHHRREASPHTAGRAVASSLDR
jgi:hypothetical protein